MSGSRYHHGHLREALLAEAVAVAREQGPDAVVVRELARRLGVSHNAGYRHFAHRDDLIAAVAEQAYAKLVEAMERELTDIPGDEPTLLARRRLATIGRAYIAFAVAEPGLFRIAYTPQAAGRWADSTPSPYRLLTDALDELVDVGFLSPQARAGAEISCWSAVHGFAMLNIDGPLAGLQPADRAEAVDQVMIAIDRSYAATTGTAVDPADLLFD